MEVLVSDGMYQRFGALLTAAAPDATWRRMHVGGTILGDGTPANALEIAWASVDVLTSDELRSAFFEVLDSSDQLRFVQTASAGTDMPLFAGLLARGVRVEPSHVNAIPIAEYVVRAILDHYQDAAAWRSARVDRRWARHDFREIRGSTWLIIGCGAIGSAIASLACSFGARVIGVRRNPTGNEPVDEMISPSETEDALPLAHVVVVATPATAETHHLVDREFLARMRADSVLVNVARGSLVDEDALLEALSHGCPAHAVLDVFATEPLPADSPWWDHPRVELTPHSAAGGLGRIERGASVFAESLRRYRRDEASLGPVAPRVPTKNPIGERPRFATLREIRHAARLTLPDAAWDYVEEGAGGEWTLAANEAAFSRVQFRPQIMTGAGEPDIHVRFLGLALSFPVVVAPFAMDTWMHPAGQLAVVEGTERAGTVAICSSSSGHRLEAVRSAAPDAAAVFQISAMGPRELFVRLGDRAGAAGFAALCVTVDVARVGWRERALESNDRPDPASSMANYSAEDHAARTTAATTSWTWPMLANACAEIGLPWIAKGVLGASSARAAVDAGAVSVLVSNHGGRQLDGAPAALDALVGVADEIAGEVPIGLDGGVRRGSDVVKALALGASYVGVGRPVAYGLAADGAAGVTRVLELLRDEMITTMALVGCSTVADLDRSFVEPSP